MMPATKLESDVGRTRRIMKDDILDAAERVIVRLGSAGLSIDAVAQEAGVSKATVVYDHKSKAVLLEALVDRLVSKELERTEASVREHASSPHPELFGRIAAAGPMLSEADKAVALAISASMSSEEKLQGRIREWTATDLKAMAEGQKPEAALMAYLALTGFYSIEIFESHTWSETERNEILGGIRTIYSSYPDE